LDYLSVSDAQLEAGEINTRMLKTPQSMSPKRNAATEKDTDREAGFEILVNFERFHQKTKCFDVRGGMIASETRRQSAFMQPTANR
jgi:hypothetical protein